MQGHKEGMIHATTLFECAGDFAWVIIVESAVILILYLLVVFQRFIPSARRAPTIEQHSAWVSLTLVFVMCSISGYGTVILSGWFSEWAYLLKSCSMFFVILGTAFFWHSTRNHYLVVADDSDIVQKARDIINEEGLTVAEAFKQLRETLDKYEDD
jgi:hypothetical protein